MKIDVISIFPELIRAGIGYSIVQRAIDSGALVVTAHDLRDFTTDKHRSTDDSPYGGGAGMVMRPEPLFAAVESLQIDSPARIVLLSPQGRTLTQPIAQELANEERLVLLCGHYEGFDERVRSHLATDEISIGDYVLTGGELAALVVIDATVRLLPGTLGNADSASDESFEEGLLEYPHYTRPALFREWAVPDILLSGHHAQIAAWRRKERFRRTIARRPDLWAKFAPSKSDQKLIQQLMDENPACRASPEKEEETSCTH